MNYYISKFMESNNESRRCDLCGNAFALRISLENNDEDVLIKPLCVECIVMLDKAKREFMDSTFKSLKERKVEIGE